MSSVTKTAVVLFGSALALLGLMAWFSGGTTLPTREPLVHFHFRGFALFLLGLSPLVAGALCVAVARGIVQRDSRLTQLALAFAMAALGLAFVMAPKAAA